MHVWSRLGRLLLDRVDDGLVAVADVHHADAAGEIDELVALEVDEGRAVRGSTTAAVTRGTPGDTTADRRASNSSLRPISGYLSGAGLNDPPTRLPIPHGAELGIRE